MINKVNIIITHHCNLYCKHCYMNANNKEIEDNKVLLNRFNNLLPKLKECNINEVMLTGGECTISPNFNEIVDQCLKNKLKVNIFTNGMIITEKHKYIDSFNLSIDGNKNYHNYLRGNDKSYDSVIETIKKLTSMKKNISIQMTVSKDNYLDIQSTAENLFKLGINKLNLCCLLDEGRCIKNKINTNVDINKIRKIIYKTLDKTGYNLQIHTNIFNKYSKKFLCNRSITFPLWIDLVNNSFYLIKDDSIFSKDLNDFSLKNIEMLYNKIHKFIKCNNDSILKEDNFILENEIIKLLNESRGHNE